MNEFKELGLSDKLLGSIERLEFTQPTKIQRDAIPLILEGKDVIGESETGSGKTLAFGCGIVEKCNRNDGIQALVLTPTRELAEQVKDSLKELTYKPRLNVIAVFGGVSIYNQIKNLTRANVVVATPGRLLDHIERGTVNLSNVKILVMDEADRMFDMGFIDDVKKIIKRCPEERQTLFFSATISKDVKKLANRHMVAPEIVLAGNIVDPSKLRQTTVTVPKSRKFSLLTHILKEEDDPLAMIFCNTRHLSDYIDSNLRSHGIKTAAIHGGLTQNARLKAIDRFNAHEVNVLVCTDVAARGLHIKNVSHVINYDLPQDPNDYIHRIGRTARAGESGQVINLLTNFDKNLMKKIQWQNKTFNIERVETPEFKDIDFSRDNERRGRGNRTRNEIKEPGHYKKESNGGRNNFENKKKQWKSSRNSEGNSKPDYRGKPDRYKPKPRSKSDFDDTNGKSDRPKSGGYKGKTDNYKSKSEYKPRSNGYKPKSGGYKGKSDEYKPKSDGYKPKSGGYKGKSQGYEPRPDGYNSKPGSYKGTPGGYGSKPKSQGQKTGGYKGKPDTYKPKTGNYNKKSDGYKPKSGSYRSKSGGNHRKQSDGHGKRN